MLLSYTCVEASGVKDTEVDTWRAGETKGFGH